MKPESKSDKSSSQKDLDLKVKDLKTEKRRKALFYLGLLFCIVIFILTLVVFFYWVSQNQV